MDRRRTAGIALLALAFILWGAMGTAAQFLFALDAGFTPASLVAMRLLAAGVLFLTVAGIARPGPVFGVLRDRTMMIGMLLAALCFSARTSPFLKPFGLRTPAPAPCSSPRCRSSSVCGSPSACAVPYRDGKSSA